MTWRRADQPDDASRSPYMGLSRPGGDWHGLRPSFDNPLTWSIYVLRIAGIDVRIHIVFLIFIAVQLLRTLTEPSADVAVPLDLTTTAIVMGALVLVVLLHEIGHCIACRMSGGDADEILMWPLGGLAFCHPGRSARAHLITALGGPLVNVAICLAATASLVLATGLWTAAIPNPLELFGGLRKLEIARSHTLRTIYIVNAMSLTVLLFNLLPMFPLDGGRIVLALLWPRYGYANAMRIAVRIGFVGAILLGVFGAVLEDLVMLGVACFGGIVCYITHKQLEFTEQIMHGEGGDIEEYAQEFMNDDHSVSLDVFEEIDDEAPTATTSAPALTLKQIRSEEEELDRLLAKIAEQGMTGLTDSERAWLDAATQRRRHPQDGGDRAD